MSVLWIAHVTVTDEAAYAKYAAIATKAIAEGVGVILARGGRYLQLEGTEHARNVVVRYPSLEAAEAVYHSATYQEALSHAVNASVRDVVIVEEV